MEFSTTQRCARTQMKLIWTILNCYGVAVKGAKNSHRMIEAWNLIRQLLFGRQRHWWNVGGRLRRLLCNHKHMSIIVSNASLDAYKCVFQRKWIAQHYPGNSSSNLLYSTKSTVGRMLAPMVFAAYNNISRHIAKTSTSHKWNDLHSIPGLANHKPKNNKEQCRMTTRTPLN